MNFLNTVEVPFYFYFFMYHVYVYFHIFACDNVCFTKVLTAATLISNMYIHTFYYHHIITYASCNLHFKKDLTMNKRITIEVL